MSSSWVMVLKLTRIAVFFLQFFAYVSKKPTADIAIYVYVSKSSLFALLDNDVDYYVMTYDLELLISWSSVF